MISMERYFLKLWNDGNKIKEKYIHTNDPLTTAEKHDSFFLMSIDYLLDSIKQPSGKKIPFYIPYFSGDKSLKAHLGKDPATKSDEF